MLHIPPYIPQIHTFYSIDDTNIQQTKCMRTAVYSSIQSSANMSSFTNHF